MFNTCSLLVLHLCLLCAAVVCAAPHCKWPYVRVQDDYCYYVAREKLHTSFNNFCYKEKRTSRVCLDDGREMRALAAHLYANGYADGARFWSAGSRWPGDLQFYWNYYGRAQALNYTNWQPGEPSPAMGRNCMLLTLSGGDLVMSSESCYTEAVDICEMSLSSESSAIKLSY